MRDGEVLLCGVGVGREIKFREIDGDGPETAFTGFEHISDAVFKGNVAAVV